MITPLTQLEYPDETIPPDDYPEDDGKPMAEGDAQRKYIAYATEALADFFKQRDDVYVAGNLFIYYEQGNPEAVVTPDTFVIFGASPENRRSYKVWEEGGHCPSFVLEITSKSTVSQDLGAKKGIYAYLGVQEYFLFDPTSDYLSPPLQGWVLDQANYFPIVSESLANGYSLKSQALGLELHWDGQVFRFYDPIQREPLRDYSQERDYRQALQAELDALKAQLQERQSCS